MILVVDPVRALYKVAHLASRLSTPLLGLFLLFDSAPVALFVIVAAVVLLDLLDTRIEFFAYGNYRNSSFQCKGTPGVSE